MTGGPGGELEIFDLTALNQVAAVPGHAAQVNCMVAGPESSNIFFSGSADRYVMLHLSSFIPSRLVASPDAAGCGAYSGRYARGRGLPDLLPAELRLSFFHRIRKIQAYEPMS